MPEPKTSLTKRKSVRILRLASTRLLARLFYLFINLFMFD